MKLPDVTQWEFSVIYSFDLSRDQYVGPWKPPDWRKWQMTEDDSCYEYGYLADECGRREYRNGKHRKYCAVLDYERFAAFVEDIGLYPEDVETLGSIGAPGFGMGWAPAISFRFEGCGYDDPIDCGAYVTPLPFDPETVEGIYQDKADAIWQAVGAVTLEHFGG